MSVSGNDGRHPDVVSKVTVEFVTFTNATVENSVTMQITKAPDFLATYYRPMLELLREDLESGDILNIYSVDERDDAVEVYLAISSSQGNFLYLIIDNIIHF